MTLSNDRQAEIDSLDLHQISLLEEKLQVARRRQKVGEVVIRKQVETRIVQLPIRREKLIVEKIGKNPEQIAEVIIAEEMVNGLSYDELSHKNNFALEQTKFISLDTARKLLAELAELPDSGKLKLRLDLFSDAIAADKLPSPVKQICDRHEAINQSPH